MEPSRLFLTTCMRLRDRQDPSRMLMEPLDEPPYGTAFFGLRNRRQPVQGFGVLKPQKQVFTIHLKVS